MISFILQLGCGSFPRKTNSRSHLHYRLIFMLQLTVFVLWSLLSLFQTCAVHVPLTPLLAPRRLSLLLTHLVLRLLWRLQSKHIILLVELPCWHLGEVEDILYVIGEVNSSFQSLTTSRHHNMLAFPIAARWLWLQPLSQLLESVLIQYLRGA